MESLEYKSILKNIKNSEIKMYSNNMGGHAFIIDIGNGKVLKSATTNEISFYEKYKNTKFEIYELLPKYFGVLEKSQEEFSVIQNFIEMSDILFQDFLRNFDLENFDINIEQDPELNIKLESLLNDKKIFPKDKNFSFTSLKFLKQELDSMNRDKLKWTLFWFVKWRHLFLNYDFIILEDLTYNMAHPAILDMKIGFNIMRNLLKPMAISFNECGLRIMGMQVLIIF
jgi:hypothetical protein